MPSSASKKTSPPPPTPVPTAGDPDSRYAADAWLAGGVGGMEDLQVPSGQLCLVRRPGLEGLIKAGVLRNVDSLSALVNEKHIKRAKGKGSAAVAGQDEIDVQSLMNDPQALEQILYTVDKVVCHCVVKPEIHPAPADVTSRKPGVVYSDMIDITDKMFIFDFVVGGTRDLETFRRGLDESVGSLEPSEGVHAAS